jgi:hypothetical protein
MSGLHVSGHYPNEAQHRKEHLVFLRLPGHAQRFLSAFSGISSHFRPRRHRLTAERYRREMALRFTMWNQVTGTAAAPDTRHRGPTDPPQPCPCVIQQLELPNKLTTPSQQTPRSSSIGGVSMITTSYRLGGILGRGGYSTERCAVFWRWASCSWSSREMMRQAASTAVPWSTSSRTRAAMRNWCRE